MTWVRGNRQSGVSVGRVSGRRLVGVKRKYAWRVNKWHKGKVVFSVTYLTRPEALRDARKR